MIESLKRIPRQFSHLRIAATAASLAAVVICCLLLPGCDGSVSPPQTAELQSLRQIGTRDLDLSQPSGLTLGASDEVLWAVGNRPEWVYMLSLEGEILDTLAFVGEDVEGIVFDPSDSSLWIAEERAREVVHLTRNGEILNRLLLDIEGKSNSGFEGIALDAKGNLFILNEKNPGLLVALDDDLNISAKYELDFARDYSGLTYDARRDAFWISSHQDRCLHLWSVPDGHLASYRIPIDKIEGVTVDQSGNRLYVVSESERSLTVFDLTLPE